MLVLKQILIVALGGALGSVARYKIGGFALHHTQAWDFPLSTFYVNASAAFSLECLPLWSNITICFRRQRGCFSLPACSEASQLSRPSATKAHFFYGAVCFK